MPFQPLLAHGSLGAYDELIFLSVSVIFLVMMGISWVTSRNAEPPPSDELSEPLPDTQPIASDRFPLE